MPWTIIESYLRAVKTELQPFQSLLSISTYWPPSPSSNFVSMYRDELTRAMRNICCFGVFVSSLGSSSWLCCSNSSYTTRWCRSSANRSKIRMGHPRRLDLWTYEMHSLEIINYNYNYCLEKKKEQW